MSVIFAVVFFLQTPVKSTVILVLNDFLMNQKNKNI